MDDETRGISFENLKRKILKMKRQTRDIDAQIDETVAYMEKLEKHTTKKTTELKEDTQFTDMKTYETLKEMTIDGHTFKKGEQIQLSTKLVADRNMVPLGFVKMVGD